VNTWLAVKYHSNPGSAVTSGIRSRTAFLAFASWWTVIFSIGYTALFWHSSNGSFLTSVASHGILCVLLGRHYSDAHRIFAFAASSSLGSGGPLGLLLLPSRSVVETTAGTSACRSRRHCVDPAADPSPAVERHADVVTRSTIQYNLPYCNQLNASMGFAWAVW